MHKPASKQEMVEAIHAILRDGCPRKIDALEVLASTLAVMAVASEATVPVEKTIAIVATGARLTSDMLSAATFTDRVLGEITRRVNGSPEADKKD